MNERREGWFRWRFLVPVLAVALLASLAWGYTQYRARRAWEVRAENQYNRSFSELALHVAGLETQLAKAAVANSPKQQVRLFTEAWRQAYHAQEDLGQLPLASVELARTKDFLTKVQSFSFGFLSGAGSGNGLTEEKWQTLQDLHRQARYLSGELFALQERILEGAERWLNVDRVNMTATTADLPQRLETNKVTKSFLMMEDGLRRLPEPEIEGTPRDFQAEPKGLKGPRIAMEEARRNALRFLERDGGEYEADYDGEIKGKLPLYLFNLRRKGGGRGREARETPIQLAVSTKGSHVAWMLRERMISGRELSLEEAAGKAQEFLRKREYPEMVPIAIEEFRNAAIVSLARKSGETVIQPETIKVQVALDNGEVLGVEAIPYLTFRDPERKIPSPRLSPAEARKKLNPRLRVEEVKKTVILNDRFQEILCYEWDTYLDKERFLVYINALTGEEERIKRVDRRGMELE
jgi:spore germination protein